MTRTFLRTADNTVIYTLEEKFVRLKKNMAGQSEIDHGEFGPITDETAMVSVHWAVEQETFTDFLLMTQKVAHCIFYSIIGGLYH